LDWNQDRVFLEKKNIHVKIKIVYDVYWYWDLSGKRYPDSIGILELYKWKLVGGESGMSMNGWGLEYSLLE